MKLSGNFILRGRGILNSNSTKEWALRTTLGDPKGLLWGHISHSGAKRNKCILPKAESQPWATQILHGLLTANCSASIQGWGAVFQYGGYKQSQKCFYNTINIHIKTETWWLQKCPNLYFHLHPCSLQYGFVFTPEVNIHTHCNQADLG